MANRIDKITYSKTRISFDVVDTETDLRMTCSIDNITKNEELTQAVQLVASLLLDYVEGKK